MDTDEIIEYLLDSGVPENKVKEMMSIMEGRIQEPEFPENFLETLETLILLEKDPIMKARMVARKISLELDN